MSLMMGISRPITSMSTSRWLSAQVLRPNRVNPREAVGNLLESRLGRKAAGVPSVGLRARARRVPTARSRVRKPEPPANPLARVVAARKGTPSQVPSRPRMPGKANVAGVAGVEAEAAGTAGPRKAADRARLDS